MRSDAGERTLVMSDGDLTGLVARAMVSRPGETVVWLLPRSGTRRRAAAKAQGAALGFETVEADARQGAFAGMPEELIDLFLACRSADRHGCDRVVLPACRGMDADGIYAVDSAIADVGRFLAEAGVRREPEIVTPLLDLTTEQVADLALDLGVAMELCWWDGRFAGLCDEGDPDAERWVWEGAMHRACRAFGRRERVFESPGSPIATD